MGVIRFSQTGLRDIVLLGSDYGWSSLPCLRPCLECWFAHNVSVGLFSGRRQVLVGLENDRMWYGVEPCRVTALECFAALGIRTRVSPIRVSKKYTTDANAAIDLSSPCYLSPLHFWDFFSSESVAILG